MVSVDALVATGQRGVVGVADEPDRHALFVPQVVKRLLDLRDEAVCRCAHGRLLEIPARPGKLLFQRGLPRRELRACLLRACLEVGGGLLAAGELWALGSIDERVDVRGQVVHRPESARITRYQFQPGPVGVDAIDVRYRAG